MDDLCCELMQVFFFFCLSISVAPPDAAVKSDCCVPVSANTCTQISVSLDLGPHRGQETRGRGVNQRRQRRLQQRSRRRRGLPAVSVRRFYSKLYTEIYSAVDQLRPARFVVRLVGAW